MIAAGLDEAGLEDLSDIELARRIPPEIAMYEDLFKKILKSAEILVQFGADAVPPADATFQNKSTQAAQSRVDRYHLRHEQAAHHLLAAAQTHRSKTLSEKRELAARRFYAREESLADIHGKCVPGMASRLLRLLRAVQSRRFYIRSLSFCTRSLLTRVSKPSKLGRSSRVVKSRRADKARTDFLTPHIIAQRVARTLSPREQVVNGVMSRTVSSTLLSAQKHVLDAGIKASFLDEK